MNKKKPLISIIITSRNEEEVINNLIRSLKEQSFKNLEIILVDNSSTDKTVEIAKAHNIRICNFGPERSAQRNYGANMAKGRYLLFLDADMYLGSRVVEECIESFKKDSKVGGIVIPENSIAYNFWEKVKAYERSFYNQLGDQITDAERCFSKEAFLKTGGYDEILTGPEDWDLSVRIRKDYKVARISAKITHYGRTPSLFSLAKKKFYYGLSAYKYLSKNKIFIINPKTIYFLRPIFYKNWRKLLAHPILCMGMFLMFLVELIGGGLGYLVGRIESK